MMHPLKLKAEDRHEGTRAGDGEHKRDIDPTLRQAHPEYFGLDSHAAYCGSDNILYKSHHYNHEPLS